MKLTDIVKELAKFFDAMGDTGGVVVWHDPDSEFAQIVGEIELPGVEVLREEENDLFRLKAELNGDLCGRRVLLYRPRERRLEGDWLADVEVRSEQFSADYASIQLRELGAPDTREMRDALLPLPTRVRAHPPRRRGRELRPRRRLPAGDVRARAPLQEPPTWHGSL